jgi:cytochrome c
MVQGNGDAMSFQWSRFTTALILLAVLMAGAVAFDLGYRGLHQFPTHPEWPMGHADAGRGRELLRSYGCGACHVIPGIRHANGRVGPKLEDIVHQMFIAGVLPNTPDGLTAWIQHPQQINPLTAMPDLNVTEEEARDMVAYLYSLR